MNRRIIVAAAVLVLTAITLGAAATTEPAESPIHFRKIVLTTQFYSEGANVGDFDRDGHVDVVAGPFWYAGPDFRTRHTFIPAAATQPLDPHGYSKNFFAFVDDLNSDSFPDILIVGFPGEE